MDTTIAPQLNPLTPMGFLNCRNWYITLPSKLKAPVDTVKMPDLIKYSDKFFYLNSTKDGVVFVAPCDGAHTQNSSNPRSELREMSADGSQQAAWSSTVGTHSMEIEQCVDVLPIGSKPVVVTGQIHDAKDDVTVFRVEANRYSDNTGDKALNSIWITTGNTPHGKLLTNSYRLGDKFRVGFIVSGGKVTYTLNGQPVAGYSLAKSGSGWYFKAGCYNQSGGIITKLPSGESDFAQVTVYAVQVCHDGVCFGNAPGATTIDPPVDPLPVDVQAIANELTAALQRFQSGAAAAGIAFGAEMNAAIAKLWTPK